MRNGACTPEVLRRAGPRARRKIICKYFLRSCHLPSTSQKQKRSYPYQHTESETGAAIESHPFPTETPLGGVIAKKSSRARGQNLGVSLSVSALVVHHLLLLCEQGVIHLSNPLRQIPCEPWVPLYVCHGDALGWIGHQNPLQQVLALWRHLLVVGKLVVHTQDALQRTNHGV